MALLLPLWAVVSLAWAALAWLFPAHRFLGLAIAVVHLALSVSAVLLGIVEGVSDDGLPQWIIVPGIMSAVIRVAVELRGVHGKRQ
ncbi:hypothetical protein AB0I94_35160 [Streptomyces sp. NPDC050147]|uniref:hypothetical protein n=1 Tax=Streptomyces sp. NPDC050147 TaxID=3155513 RepID=UPI00342D9D78